MRSFALVFGAFLGLSLLKFGNPPILEKYISPPGDVYELVLGYPWPIGWAYRLLAGVAGFGAVVLGWRIASRRAGNQAKRDADPRKVDRRDGRREKEQASPESVRGCPTLVLVLPLAWLAWQTIATSQSVQGSLSAATLAHFAATVLCFYLGYFGLGRARLHNLFWLGLFCAFCVVLAFGWHQRFGGLEETRRYLELYEKPRLESLPPEFLERLRKNRIFSTLFYPNTLAGVILLLLPPLMVFIGTLKGRLTAGARAFVAAVVLVGALGCLYWSGSKGGWLLMLGLGLVVILSLPGAGTSRPRTTSPKPSVRGDETSPPLSARLLESFVGKRAFKLILVCAVLVAGLAGFFWKYSAFFHKGATSVVARFEYWQAAARTVVSDPLFGTGPGTFFIAYQRYKRPGAEQARLVHNDYLEQASDSGLPGFLLYMALITTSLGYGWPGRPSLSGPNVLNGLQAFSVWLGVLGWALQGLVEFGLYIPALAWPAFTFMGWLLAIRTVKRETACHVLRGKT